MGSYGLHSCIISLSLHSIKSSLKATLRCDDSDADDSGSSSNSGISGSSSVWLTVALIIFVQSP